MSTETLERPGVRDTGTPPELFHYVRKTHITASAVEGHLVEALCGELFPVTKTPKAGSPVCPPCAEIYRQMQP